MFERVVAIIGLVAAGLLLVIINIMTPSTAGAMGVLAVFLLSYVVLISFFTYVIWIAGKLYAKFRAGAPNRKKTTGITFKKAYYYSTIIALAPVILLSLQSVGGVGIYEVGLIAIFVLLGCIYITRRTA